MSIVEIILAVSAGIAERGADDDVAEPDPFGQRGQGRQRRERLERDLVGRAGDGLEVVEQPDRLEAEALGLPGDLRRPAPRLERLPAVVLADPALRNDRPDLHLFASRWLAPVRAIIGHPDMAKRPPVEPTASTIGWPGRGRESLLAEADHVALRIGDDARARTSGPALKLGHDHRPAELDRLGQGGVDVGDADVGGDVADRAALLADADDDAGLAGSVIP